jgi:phosphatidylglycerophosphate synthase
MPTEFIVLPPAARETRVTSSLLGLGLGERCRKMLSGAGLVETASIRGDGPLVVWPGELVGPGNLGKEVAAVVPSEGDAIAFGPEGEARPAVVLGAFERTRAAEGNPEPGKLYARAVAAAARRVVPAAPAVAIHDAEGRRAARRMLLRALRKSNDGVVSRTLNRPVSIAMSSFFATTPITPNQLTFLTFLFALLGAWLVASQWFVLGTLTLQFASILDGCDGEVARLKYQSSKLGAWLDTVLDDISNVAFAVGMGYGLFRAMGDDHPVVGMSMLLLGLATGVCAITAVLFEYRRVLRDGERVDTGNLEWDNSGETNAFRRFLIDYLAPIVKRDAYYFIFLVFALMGPLTGLVTTCLVPFFYFVGAFLAMYTIVTDRSAG